MEWAIVSIQIVDTDIYNSLDKNVPVREMLLYERHHRTGRNTVYVCHCNIVSDREEENKSSIE